MRETINTYGINNSHQVIKLLQAKVKELAYTFQDKFRKEPLVFAKLHLFIVQGNNQAKNSVELIELKDWNVNRLNAFLSQPLPEGVTLSAPAITPDMDVRSLYVTYTVGESVELEDIVLQLLK